MPFIKKIFEHSADLIRLNNNLDFQGPTGPMGPQGPPGISASELTDMRNKISRLENLLNILIDDPEKAKLIKNIDPYGEENWQ